MNHIETITGSGYELYRQLKALGFRAESLQALHIAQEIHEVKRILNGYMLVFQRLLVKRALALLYYLNYCIILKKVIGNMRNYLGRKYNLIHV